jgi:hypothetical protein
MNQGAGGLVLMEKTALKKSHDTVLFKGPRFGYSPKSYGIGTLLLDIILSLLVLQ